MLSFNQVDSTKRKLISYEWLPVHLLLGGGKSRFFMRLLWADSFIWLSCRRVRSETRAQSNRTGEGENGLCCPWSNMLMKKKWSTVSQGKKNYTPRRLREMEKIFLSLSLSLLLGRWNPSENWRGRRDRYDTKMAHIAVVVLLRCWQLHEQAST